MRSNRTKSCTPKARAASGAAARVGVADSAGIAPTAARIATAAVKPLARIVKLSLRDGWFPIVALARQNQPCDRSAGRAAGMHHFDARRNPLAPQWRAR